MDDPDATLEQSGGFPVRLPVEATGELIGKYKLLQNIGEGGFGTVWMAEQKEPVRRRVALKIIKLGMDTKQVIARFEAERQALAMMDHPNIAKVFDAGATEAGRPYFVMELVKGVPILEYCDTEKLGTRARLDLFSLVCHAIQHAHQKGIIHRDIKPGNVLVTLHDGVPVPKVIDFGIAKATSQELTQKTLFTEHHQMIGTPAYMSPEQAEMSGLDIDTRSDIYSLGVLLYELLTGTTPFAHQELMERGFAEMMRIIREETPHKPSTRLSTLGDTGTRTAQLRHTDPKRLNLTLRGDLDWIVMKCLEKDRTRRYDTANGLAADILRHLSDEPVSAGPPSAGYKVRKFVKRNRGQVIASALIAAVLVLGVLGTSVGLVWALRERNRADEQAIIATAAAKSEESAKLLAQANEQEAIAEAQRAERELSRATEIKWLIKDMLSSVDPEEAQGADITLLKGILDNASDRLGEGKVSDELVAAELHHLIGDVYAQLGLYAQSERHLPVATEVRSRLLGEQHRDTILSKWAIARLYSYQAQYAMAEAMYLQTLEVVRSSLGQEHEYAIGVMTGLTVVYQGQGRYKEAEGLTLEILEMQKRLLGEEHQSTLKSLSNLAIIYSEQGRFAEAEVIYLQLRETQQRLLGEDDPRTHDASRSLAGVYANQRRFDEAEPLLVNGLELRRRLYGSEHPKTLMSMYNLALVYKKQGRLGEAQPLMEQVYEAQARVLGAEHPYTLTTIKSLADIEIFNGRLHESESMYLDVLEIQRRTLGPEHPDTLGTITDIGTSYAEIGEYERAAEMFEASLPIKRRVLGDQHPWTGIAALGLANAYSKLGRFEDAEGMYILGIEIQQSVNGPDDPASLIGMSDLAFVYLNLERYEDAAALQRELLDANARIRGSEDPETLGTVTNLGLSLIMLERYDEAAVLFEQSLPVKRRLLGLDHPWTANAMWGLANAYMKLERRDDSIRVHRELLEIETAGADDPDADAVTLDAAAWSLLNYEIEELQDAPKAFGFAQRACALEDSVSGSSLWMYLETLALAQNRIGDHAAAVQTQLRAISLTPEGEQAGGADQLSKYREDLDGETQLPDADE